MAMLPAYHKASQASRSSEEGILLIGVINC